MQLSDAERERLVTVLQDHVAGGAIDTGELERRVEVLLRAETYEAAQAVLADLPPTTVSSQGPGAARPRRGRGHGEAPSPQAGWQPTAERFRDPRSQRVMRVWIDASGGRHYLAEPPEGIA